MTKESYELLRKKYSLPDYDELNRNFDIEEIHQDSKIMLSKIRIRMVEKLDYYTHLLSMCVQPDSDLNFMFEAKYTDDESREKAFGIYKRLMLMIRKSNLVSIANSEGDNAEFIKEAYKSWQAVKEDLSEHFNKLVKYWDQSTDAKGELNYFG